MCRSHPAQWKSNIHLEKQRREGISDRRGSLAAKHLKVKHTLCSAFLARFAISRASQMLHSPSANCNQAVCAITLRDSDIWPRDRGSSGSCGRSHTSSEMPLSLIVLCVSWLLWNPFCLFEYSLSGKEKRPCLNPSRPNFWRGVSDSKRLHGSFTDEIPISPRPDVFVSQWLHFLYTGSVALPSLSAKAGVETAHGDRRWANA